MGLLQVRPHLGANDLFGLLANELGLGPSLLEELRHLTASIAQFGHRSLAFGRYLGLESGDLGFAAGQAGDAIGDRLLLEIGGLGPCLVQLLAGVRPHRLGLGLGTGSNLGRFFLGNDQNLVSLGTRFGCVGVGLGPQGGGIGLGLRPQLLARLLRIAQETRDPVAQCAEPIDVGLGHWSGRRASARSVLLGRLAGDGVVIGPRHRRNHPIGGLRTGFGLGLGAVRTGRHGRGIGTRRFDLGLEETDLTGHTAQERPDLGLVEPTQGRAELALLDVFGTQYHGRILLAQGTESARGPRR